MNSIHEISSQGGSNASLPDTDGDISNDVINFMDDDSAAGHFLFDLKLLPEDIQLEAEDDLEANNEDDSSGTLMSVYSLEVPHQKPMGVWFLIIHTWRFSVSGDGVKEQ
jgi:hypothetical protein